ncbi:hypothetical protein ABWI01_14195 [Oceanicaulis alexandrii]|uniref:hypothetical protein n=1 Tax=Oceanicaulis alexandrii TaxID=153233 RepID=UPI0035CF7626
MKNTLSKLLIPGAAALVLTSCSSLPDLPKTPLGRTESVASDTVGLPRARPGQIVIDDGDETVPTPYGGSGAAVSCPALARDIARLTSLLGPDIEAPRPETRTNSGEQDEGMLDRSRDFASSIAEDAPDLAADTARDTIVGLNPTRPVVRFLGRAGEIEAAAAQERELALKRRAWLRGGFDALSCERATLIEAMDAYGLLTETATDREG